MASPGPGGLTRRRTLGGLIALAGLAATRSAARAQQATQQKVGLTLPGGKPVAAALFLPVTLPAAAIVVAPDRFGLIEPMLDQAGALSFEHYIVVAVDLYDGAVAADGAQAQVLEAALDRAQAVATLTAWTDWVRADARCNRHVGLMGFGLGGGLALDAALSVDSRGAIRALRCRRRRTRSSRCSPSTSAAGSTITTRKATSPTPPRRNIRAATRCWPGTAASPSSMPRWARVAPAERQLQRPPATRRAGRDASCSSNSEASWSIMVPPNWSASTMVTARR